MTNISSIVKSARNIMRQDTGTGSDEIRILQLGWMLFLKIFSDKDKELELIQDNYTSPIPHLVKSASSNNFREAMSCCASYN